MPLITLPNGTKKYYSNALSVYDVASSIDGNLARKALAGVVNNVLVDVDFIIENDTTLRVITAKDKEGLEILRHSCAHLLAQAVKKLYPGVKTAIGPVIEDGFYYDFSCDISLTTKDLLAIEDLMFNIARSSQRFTRRVSKRDSAIKYFESLREDYKVEIIKGLPQDQAITLYTQGEFKDLCHGPHIPDTSHLQSFKLMRVTGAYWRGDSNNEMLTRIYGTCWPDNTSLKNYLNRLEEAEKRDHRKIGRQLNLFHFQDDSPGMTFWHPKGTTIWRIIEDYIRSSNIEYGCKEVRTPLIADISLWEKSGHADKYSENMFTTHSEKREFVIRPMNCPTCVQIYNRNLHSYRDLPVRMTEFGIVHRNETSGSLHGLFRARSFTQDDGHVFCQDEQVEQEVCLMIKQCFEVYNDFGFTEIDTKLALRPNNRIGSDAIWDKSEQVLVSSLESQGISFDYLIGEGAFYGPKIEFHLKDAIGRSWQCGTIQLDLSMPIKLGAKFIDSDSQKQVPIMLHRAILGSLERFIGILIEHYSGNLPVWLAPTQVTVLSISSEQDTYATEVHQNLINNKIRSQIDLRNEKIGFKIREHTLKKIPFAVVVGRKEVTQGKIAVRKQNGTDLGRITLLELKKILENEVLKKGRLN